MSSNAVLRHAFVGRSAALLLCCASVLAVADMTPFEISTIGQLGDPPAGAYYSTTGYVSVSDLFGGTAGHVGIATSFLFSMPDGYDPLATGARVTSLTVPFFEDVTGTDFADAVFSIVTDSSGAPNLAGTVATFQMPAADWPDRDTAVPPSPDVVSPDGTLASLTTVSAASSGVFLDNGLYWLVVQTSGYSGNAGDNAFEYWYVSNTASNAFRSGYTASGLPTTGSGNSPAFELGFVGVPEPTAGGLLVLAGGLIGLVNRRRRR